MHRQCQFQVGEKSRKTSNFRPYSFTISEYCSAKSTELDRRDGYKNTCSLIFERLFSKSKPPAEQPHGARVAAIKTIGNGKEGIVSAFRRGASALPPLRYSGNDGAALAAGCLAAEDDGAAAGEGTGAAAIASIGPAGEGAAAGDTSASDSALADGDAPAAGDGTAGAAAEVA